MKICLISEEYPPETGWGGIGTHNYNLSVALSELGHDVHVLTKSIDGKVYISEKGNLHVYRLPESTRKIFPQAVEKVAYRVQKKEVLKGFTEYPLHSLYRGAAISRWLKSKPSFDIIEAPDYGAETFLCQFINRLKTPIVIKLHTPLFLSQRLNSHPKNNLPVRLRNWMEKYCIRHASKVISPTKSLADIIAREFIVKGIDVIPNCVDTDYFTYSEKDARKKEKILLYTGRLERRKGVEVLAKAIPIVVKADSNVKFVFVGRDTPTAEGGGSMKLWLESFIEKENVKDYVEFIGEVPRTSIVTYYQKANISVVPSLWENLPYTCLEAMSCGTPVIGSRIGGIAEIISDGKDGFLFDPGNQAALAEKIIGAFRHSNLEEMGKAARCKMEESYSHKMIAEKTVELYRNVLERK